MGVVLLANDERTGVIDIVQLFCVVGGERAMADGGVVKKCKQFEKNEDD